MLFVDEFCGILVYIKFGADVTSQYNNKQGIRQRRTRTGQAACGYKGIRLLRQRNNCRSGKEERHGRGLY